MCSWAQAFWIIDQCVLWWTVLDHFGVSNLRYALQVKASLSSCQDPKKHETELTVGLYLYVWGHCFTYLWGAVKGLNSKSMCKTADLIIHHVFVSLREQQGHRLSRLRTSRGEHNSTKRSTDTV